MSVPIRRLYDLAETCVFSKQSLEPGRCDPRLLTARGGSHTWGQPFFRSYGFNLQSSLARVLSSPLGFSPHLPVSVYGTDTHVNHLEVFLGSTIRISWLARRLVPPSSLGVKKSRICLRLPPTDLDQHIHQLADLSPLRHPIAQTLHGWYRNVNLFSIAYAFRPRLRTRLTLSGLAFLRKP